MNTLTNYIIEKLIIDNDVKVDKSNDVFCIRLYELLQLYEKWNKKAKDKITRFLKGKEFESSIDIYITKYKKYLHIFRYSDQHKIDISIVYNDSHNWPDERQWAQDGVQYNELDDREKMENLFRKFYNFLEKKFNL